MLTPKAFSMRRAISGESEALPFSSAESVALRTPRMSAALVTLRPNSQRPRRGEVARWEGVMFAWLISEALR